MASPDEQERRVVAVLLVPATLLLLASDLLFDAVRYRHGTFIPRFADLVSVGAGKAGLFRLAGLTDMLGSYLLPLPATVYLWRVLRPSKPLVVDLIALAGVGFGLIGGAAAAALSFGGSSLIRSYAAAGPGARPAIASTFASLDGALTSGVWQSFNGVLLAVWLVGLALVLRRRWRWFAAYSAVLGVAGVLGSLGLLAGQEYASSAPETVVFLPLNVWLAWLAFLLWRGAPAALSAGRSTV
ncbi:MAG: hypothetical protein H0W70_00240 [Actinobacteria bacterium]|nr:hypothetical protein [Actinomycetota bacterium]